MRDTTKRTVQNLFIGQFSNARAIEGAKTAPWWIAIILFLLGTFLPVIPIMVNQSNAYGSQFMSGTLYGYDRYLTSATVALAESETDRYAIEGKKLLCYRGGELVKQSWYSEEEVTSATAPDMTPIFVYNVVIEDKTETEEGTDITYRVRRKFNVYYSNRPYDGNGEFTIYNMLKTLTGRKYDIWAEEPTVYTGDTKDKKDTDFYNPSFVLLTEEGIYSYIYRTDSTTLMSYTGTGYDWKHFEDTNDLFLGLATVAGVPADPAEEPYEKGVMNNWKELYNKAFLNLKTRNFWMLSGIFYGIYAALTLFMGLMLWLLTRGKRNPNRGLKIYTCLQIGAWISVTPGLLALIFGFLFVQVQQILFILLIGMRTMWLAMRQLNPKY